MEGIIIFFINTKEPLLGPMGLWGKILFGVMVLVMIIYSLGFHLTIMNRVRDYIDNLVRRKEAYNRSKGPYRE